MKIISNSWLALILFGIIILAALGLRLADFFNEKTAVIKISGVNYNFVVANTDQMRFRGWSGHDSMGRYGGMYFIFPNVGINRMVMRNMRFPLDIVWLNGTTITDLAENLAPETGRVEAELTIYSNKIPGTGVLELPAGFIKQAGLKIGDKVQINNNNNNNMKLSSPTFEEGSVIPAKYTCDGQNINPPLQISDVPANTKSLVLLMDDPDIPETVRKSFSTEVWDHWVVFNIPPDTKQIVEGETPSGRLGKNTKGDLGFGGPCPPDREHRYFFKLYALDIILNIPSGSTKSEVEKAMAGHVLGTAVLMGRYARH